MKLHIQMPIPEEEDDIDITPMIDCVFLLVLFFMVTSSFIDEARAFQIVLPRADQATTVARDSADSVSLTLDGKLYIGDKLTDPEKLLAELRERQSGERSRPVILRCDARVEYQQFVRIKNVLKLAGVETIFEEVEVRRDRTQP